MRSDVGSAVDFRGATATLLPADLVAAVLVTVAADVAIVVGAPQPFRLVAAGLLLFFLPGYAIVAALYPAATTRAATTSEGSGVGRPRPRRAGIDLTERLALAFGVSVATVVLVGLLAWQIGAWTTGGISAATAAALLTLVVVGGCAVGAVRRSRLPRVERFSFPYRRWLDRARAGAFSGSRTDRLLNVALALSVLLAAGALGYAVSTPVDAERYTTASLLTEAEDGALVAGGYPADVQAGQPTALVLELENHEGVDTTYTAVVRIERVDTSGTGATVTEANELDRLSVGVPAGETRTVPHEVAPEMTGDELRLSYYLYRGSAPADPSASSAYRHVYVWLSVDGA